eukprot:scaffold114222_cov63-Phaeocystis_antarctica.AAC.2
MLAGVLTFAAAVQRPEEPSTHRRVAAPLVHGMPFRMSHNETASRLRAVASTTKLLTSDSASPSSSQDKQEHGDGNGTAEEMIAEKVTEEKVTEDVWKGYSESNQEVYPVGEEKTDSKDDADHDEATDADGAVMRTTGVTWALPEATAAAQASEASMILTNDTATSNGTEQQQVSPTEIPPVR